MSTPDLRPLARPLAPARLRAHLTGLGYSVTPAAPERSAYTLYDTQAGHLRRRGVTARRHDATGDWHITPTAPDPAGDTPPPRTSPSLEDLTEHLGLGAHPPQLLPLLHVRLTRTPCHLLTPAGDPLLVELVRVVASWPHAPAPPATLQRIGWRAPGRPAESARLEINLGAWLAPGPAEDLLTAGLRALGRPVPGDSPPPDTAVRPDDDLLAASARLLAQQAWRMWANAEGTCLDLDPEYLHDLRVATRRARFILRLLGRAIGPEAVEPLRAELAWIAGLLGVVRDLDVFLSALPGLLAAVDAPPAVGSTITAPLREQRQAARAHLVPALTGERYAALLEATRHFHSPAPPAHPVPPARAAAGPAVRRALKRVRRWAATPDDRPLSPEDLHALRIDFKRLRYTCEFFTPFLDPAIGRVIKETVRFQDTLGEHQDAYVAIDNLTALAGALPDPPDRPALLALGAMIQAQRHDADRLRADFLRRWAAFPATARRLRRSL